LLSSSDDEEEDRTRAAQPPLRLVRADLDRALPEKPPASVVRRPGAALSLEELQVRARVIDRRAQELNRASKIVAAKELPPPSDAATEADETESLAAEPERWPEVDLGLSEHGANLKRLASTDAPGGTDASTIELALEDAVCSVSACDAQQREALHTSVESLKQHFQRRLEALEADFVRRAQDLSDALARAVTERKRASEAVVAAHAEECADRLATMTQHGEVLSRLPPTPAPGWWCSCTATTRSRPAPSPARWTPAAPSPAPRPRSGGACNPEPGGLPGSVPLGRSSTPPALLKGEYGQAN
jgi:hypothetical protein